MTTEPAVPPPRITRRDFAIAGVLFLLALWQILSDVSRTPFHPDETRWLNRAHYIRDVFDPFGPTWEDGYLTRGQPPLGSYLMGIGLLLQGRDLETNGVWDFTQDEAWNVARGNLSAPADLEAGRRTSTVVGALTVVALYLLVVRLSNRVGATIAALFLVIHPLMITLASQALSDVLTTLLVVLAALAAAALADRPTWTRAVLLGVLLGLGGATKLSPMLVSLPLAALGFGLIVADRLVRIPPTTNPRNRRLNTGSVSPPSRLSPLARLSPPSRLSFRAKREFCAPGAPARPGDGVARRADASIARTATRKRTEASWPWPRKISRFARSDDGGRGRLRATVPREARPHPFAPLARKLLTLPLIAFVAFVLVNPYLWPDPIGRTQNLFEFRVEEMADQGRRWPEVAVESRVEALGRVGETLSVEYSTSGRVAARLARGLGWEWQPAGIDLPFAIVGGEILLALAIWRGPASRWALAGVVLGAQVTLIVGGMRSEYARYHLPILVMVAVSVGILAGQVWAYIVSSTFGIRFRSPMHRAPEQNGRLLGTEAHAICTDCAVPDRQPA